MTETGRKYMGRVHKNEDGTPAVEVEIDGDVAEGTPFDEGEIVRAFIGEKPGDVEIEETGGPEADKVYAITRKDDE